MLSMGITRKTIPISFLIFTNCALAEQGPLPYMPLPYGICDKIDSCRIGYDQDLLKRFVDSLPPNNRHTIRYCYDTRERNRFKRVLCLIVKHRDRKH